MARANNKGGNLCPYCTRTMDIAVKMLRPTRDHIVPKSMAAWIFKCTGYRFSRQIIVCHECNFKKADLSLSQLIDKLKEDNAELMEAIELNNNRIENIQYLMRIGLEE